MITAFRESVSQTVEAAASSTTTEVKTIDDFKGLADPCTEQPVNELHGQQLRC